MVTFSPPDSAISSSNISLTPFVQELYRFVQPTEQWVLVYANPSLSIFLTIATSNKLSAYMKS